MILCLKGVGYLYITWFYLYWCLFAFCFNSSRKHKCSSLKPRPSSKLRFQNKRKPSLFISKRSKSTTTRRLCSSFTSSSKFLSTCKTRSSRERNCKFLWRRKGRMLCRISQMLYRIRQASRSVESYNRSNCWFYRDLIRS